jgi:ubiquinone/menaquinone biosynthesis C-methylase UbiE
MKQSEIVREQFNKQAQPFSDWAVTRNVEYLKRISAFIDPHSGDSLLDVACGTGEFTLYISSMVKSVIGIDVSDKMIEIARLQKGRMNIKNADFEIAEVSHIPYPENSFELVFCKSAFHHFEDASEVFGEMVRCCKLNGKIGICDICAFENPMVDDFFEKFEKEVDISHNKTLSKPDFLKVFEENNIKVEKTFEVEIEHDVSEYLSHAIRSPDGEKRIDLLIDQARADTVIGNFWTFGNGRENTKFRKSVILLSGRKVK